MTTTVAELVRPAPAPAATPLRIPSLDGLRAISIAFVLLGHMVGSSGFPVSSERVGRLAEFGVQVFFVISGYLITGILTREMSRTGSIGLGRFYFRRTLRLFPACYALIFTVWALSSVGWLKLLPGDLPAAFLYTMNCNFERSWWLGHLWSLAVEEQFYLLWPVTLAVAGPRFGRRVLWATLILAPLVRFGMPLLIQPLHYNALAIFPAVADSLAAGCLLSMKAEQLEDHAGYRRLLASKWFWVVPAIAIGALYTPSTRAFWLVGQSVMLAALAVTVHRVILYPEDFAGRWLNSPVVMYFGVLSYSLYLWQQLFLNRAGTAWLHFFPLNLVLAAIAAVASYHLIETPLLQQRLRWEKRIFRV